jgi:hypothetical protein
MQHEVLRCVFIEVAERHRKENEIVGLLHRFSSLDARFRDLARASLSDARVDARVDARSLRLPSPEASSISPLPYYRLSAF